MDFFLVNLQTVRCQDLTYFARKKKKKFHDIFPLQLFSIRPSMPSRPETVSKSNSY